MKEFTVKEIGHVEKLFNEEKIVLNEDYIEGLKNIKGFSHLIIVWWANITASIEPDLIIDSPYKKGPNEIGVFATRSQIRPNPIAISVVDVKDIDYKKGIIFTNYIDAEDKTPILDIKPYTPSSDRIRTVGVPDWCSHWPQNYEESGMFDWENEFNFYE